MQYRDTKSIKPKTRASRTSFHRKYLAEDIVLLAETDRLHDTLSEPATKVLCVRALTLFHDLRFVRLAEISVAHLYNLRSSELYQKKRLTYKCTQRSAVAIGVRKAPNPQGMPGYIRIDTVHQGDHDGIKGVCHINAVDIVTQWELVASVERISEAYLLPDVMGTIKTPPDFGKYLKSGITKETLECSANAMSDNDAAEKVQQASN